MAFPKWKDMKFLRLMAGPGNGKQMDIAPTSENIYYQGERYFRMRDSRSMNDAGEYGGAYLWAGWAPDGTPHTQEAGAT